METPTPTSPSSSVSVFRFFTYLLVRPRRAFEALAEGRTRGWLLVMGFVPLLAVVTVLVAAPITQREILEQMRSVQILEPAPANVGPRRGPAPTPPPIPPEVQQAAINPFITVVMPAVGAVAGTFVGWLVWAAALHLLAVFLGGRSAFGTMFKAVVSAALPDGLRALFQAAYIASTQSLVLYPGLSGLVVSERAHTSMEVARQLVTMPTSRALLYHLLSKVDIFTLWRLFLLGLAVTAVARFSRRKSYALVVGVWLLFVVLSAIPTLVSMLLMGSAVMAGP